MEESQLNKKISEHIITLVKEKNVYLFCPCFEDYHIINKILLKELTIRYSLTGVYITLSQDYTTLQSHLKKKGIDVSKLYFIEGNIRKNGKTSRTGSCTSISSNSLTELSLVITDTMNNGKFDFLFLDSISTLLMHNNIKTTELFIQYIISKLREYDLMGIFISLKEDEESNKLIPILSQFCDKCIKL